MISNKYKLSLILSILLLSCSFVTDSNDTDSASSSPAGTWNWSTVAYFGNSDCSGDPVETAVFESPEFMTSYGMDEYQLKLTITVDSYIIGILTTSETNSDEREQAISTGIWSHQGDQFCTIWDSGDGDNFWDNGGGDGCDACRDYTINGDELKMTAKNCAFPLDPDTNIPCIIYTFKKQ